MSFMVCKSNIMLFRGYCKTVERGITNNIYLFLNEFFFQDWVPILTFIDRAIQSFWKEKISYGMSLFLASC